MVKRSSRFVVRQVYKVVQSFRACYSTISLPFVHLSDLRDLLLLKVTYPPLFRASNSIEIPTEIELESKGVELVQGDYDDVESLKHAFDGTYGVFAVTNCMYIEKERATSNRTSFMGPVFEAGAEKERKQGFNLVDAAVACGVRHFIWSTVEESSGSKYVLPFIPASLNIERSLGF